MESIHELLANYLVNASVPICWKTHITAFNSSGGTDISGGVAGDMCSGEQKIRGNTYLRYTATLMSVFIFACAFSVIIIDHTKKGLRTKMNLSMR